MQGGRRRTKDKDKTPGRRVRDERKETTMTYASRSNASRSNTTRLELGRIRNGVVAALMATAMVGAPGIALACTSDAINDTPPPAIAAEWDGGAQEAIEVHEESSETVEVQGATDGQAEAQAPEQAGNDGQAEADATPAGPADDAQADGTAGEQEGPGETAEADGGSEGAADDQAQADGQDQADGGESVDAETLPESADDAQDEATDGETVVVVEPGENGVITGTLPPAPQADGARDEAHTTALEEAKPANGDRQGGKQDASKDGGSKQGAGKGGGAKQDAGQKKDFAQMTDAERHAAFEKMSDWERKAALEKLPEKDRAKFMSDHVGGNVESAVGGFLGELGKMAKDKFLKKVASPLMDKGIDYLTGGLLKKDDAKSKVASAAVDAVRGVLGGNAGSYSTSQISGMLGSLVASAPGGVRLTDAELARLAAMIKSGAYPEAAKAGQGAGQQGAGQTKGQQQGGAEAARKAEELEERAARAERESEQLRQRLEEQRRQAEELQRQAERDAEARRAKEEAALSYDPRHVTKLSKINPYNTAALVLTPTLIYDAARIPATHSTVEWVRKGEVQFVAQRGGKIRARVDYLRANPCTVLDTKVERFETGIDLGLFTIGGGKTRFRDVYVIRDETDGRLYEVVRGAIVK